MWWKQPECFTSAALLAVSFSNEVLWSVYENKPGTTQRLPVILSFFLFQGWGTGSTGSCNVGSGTDALLVVSTESSPAMHSGYC